MIIFWSVWYHVFLYTEQLITIFLNLDVIQTINSPLDRSKKLEQFKKGMKLGFLVILLVCFAAVIQTAKVVDPVSELLTAIPADYFAPQCMGKLISNRSTLDIQINNFFSLYTLFQQTIWLIITVYGTILCLIAFVPKRGKDAED